MHQAFQPANGQKWQSSYKRAAVAVAMGLKPCRLLATALTEPVREKLNKEVKGKHRPLQVY